MNAQIDTDDRLLVTGQVRAALDGLMEIERYAWDERGALLLHGRLLAAAEAIYRTIRERLEPLGFTPFLQRAGDGDALLAMPGVTRHSPARIGLPVALFLATVLTALLAGAFYNWRGPIGGPGDGDGEVFLAAIRVVGTILLSPSLLLTGLPFAATLLSILFVHEMGHYIVGRLRRAPVSLPYFIPLPPPISVTGTMGAVIVQREPMEDRRTILEVGIAGPLAGLVVAIPLLIYGLATSTVGPPPEGGYLQEGNSLLYAAAKYLVFGRLLPGGGLDVQLNDVAWGAWIGLLVTMLNLLPVGQLDGGHVAYALLGRAADYLAYGVIALCVALGVTVSETWMFWGVLALLIGPRHPPPLNDISRLGPAHMALAVFGLLVFALLFMPAPLTIVGA